MAAALVGALFLLLSVLPLRADVQSHVTEPPFSEVTIDGVTDRVYAVSYSSHTDQQEPCIMLASALAHGFKMNLLGLSRKKEFYANGPLDKAWSLISFLEQLSAKAPADSIVLFVDAFDVLFLRTPAVLVRKFRRMGARILFAAEKGCCSNKWLFANRNTQCEPHWPLPPGGTETETPFINSGVIVARLDTFLEMLTVAKAEYFYTVDRLPADNPLRDDPFRQGGDQLLYGQLWTYGIDGPYTVPTNLREYFGWRLDYNQHIVHCAYHGSGTELRENGKRRVVSTGISTCDHLMYVQPPELLERCHRIQAWRAAHPGSGQTQPVFLHFNGGQKEKQMYIDMAKTVRWPARAKNAMRLGEKLLFDADFHRQVTLGRTCAATHWMFCNSSFPECLSAGPTVVPEAPVHASLPVSDEPQEGCLWDVGKSLAGTTPLSGRVAGKRFTFHDDAAGVAYKDKEPVRVHTIRLHGHATLEAIQFVVEVGPNVIELPPVGTPPAGPWHADLRLATGEYIQSMNGWAGTAVHRLELTTNRRRTVAAGTVRGELFSWSMPGAFVSGLYGDADTRINSVGAQWHACDNAAVAALLKKQEETMERGAMIAILPPRHSATHMSTPPRPMATRVPEPSVLPSVPLQAQHSPPHQHKQSAVFNAEGRLDHLDPSMDWRAVHEEHHKQSKQLEELLSVL